MQSHKNTCGWRLADAGAESVQGSAGKGGPSEVVDVQDAGASWPKSQSTSPSSGATLPEGYSPFSAFCTTGSLAWSLTKKTTDLEAFISGKVNVIL